MSFTKGPWSRNMIYGALRHINKNVEHEAFIDTDDEEYKAWRRGEMGFPNVRINPNDARLIAKAPEMLELLELWYSCTVSEISRELIEKTERLLAEIGQ